MNHDIYRPSEYWERLLARRFDLREVGYPDLSLAYNKCMYDAMTDTIARGLKELQIGAAWFKRAKVLDVGAGVGFWIDFFRGQGAQEVSGIDLTRVSIERLSARFPGLRLEQRDIADPIPVAMEEQYDLISVMSVLNHIPAQERWEAALRNLARMLRPGGYLLIMDPMVKHTAWAQTADASANGRARKIAEHVALLASYGVEIVLVRPTLSILANPVDTRSKLEFVGLSHWWRILAGIASRERLMRMLGPGILMLDRAICRTGYMPSSKVLFFRKPAA
jgi:2-polyprenyl-3-methyl-5-hydroxy-6-metoxy-1,4-benzoquinol methylase